MKIKIRISCWNDQVEHHGEEKHTKEFDLSITVILVLVTELQTVPFQVYFSAALLHKFIKWLFLVTRKQRMQTMRSCNRQLLGERLVTQSLKRLFPVILLIYIWPHQWYVHNVCACVCIYSGFDSFQVHNLTSDHKSIYSAWNSIGGGDRFGYWLQG